MNNDEEPSLAGVEEGNNPLPAMSFKDRPFFRRVLEFDGLMRQRSSTPVNSVMLAERWETSQKTVQRFVEQMRTEFDAPIEYDAQRRTYRYTDAGYHLPWLPVDGKDLFSIGVAMKVLQIYEGTPAAKDMKVVFDRLKDVMPKEVRVDPSSLVERLWVHPQPVRHVSDPVWHAVTAALRERTALSISYKKPGKEAETRRVHPYCLVLAANSWLLLARDPDDDVERVKMFYVSRMKDVQNTADRYAIPKDFSPERYFGDSIGFFVAGKPFRFKVRFAQEIADWVSEVRWHPSQKVALLADGEIEVDLPSDSIWEARRFVLSFGRFARAISPPELVEDLRKEIQAMATAARKS